MGRSRSKTEQSDRARVRRIGAGPASLSVTPHSGPLSSTLLPSTSLPSTLLSRTLLANTLLVAALLTAACVHVDPAPIDPAANAARLERRSLDDPAVAAALARRDQGASSDGIWTLDELTVAAWTLRPDVALASAEVDAARAAIPVDAQRPNPSADGSFERVTNDTDSRSPWVVGAGLGLTIETAGKREIRRRRAAAAAQALEWQLAETMWTARAALREAALVRAFARRTAALDDEEADLRRSYLGWIDTKLEFGAATTQERLTASEALSRIESQRAIDRAALASSSAALAAEVGVAALPEVAAIDFDAIPRLEDAGLAAARELALTNRLDVRRALADYAVAEQDVRAAVAQQYPNIALGPGYLYDQGDRKITLTPSLPVPLFHGAGAAVERAVAARTAAALKFDQVQADAIAQIDTSVALYRAMLGALGAAEDAEGGAERSLAAVERRLDAGAADRGEVLAARIDLLVRKRNALDALHALVDGITALEQGIQRPIFPPSTLEPVQPAPTS
jgi:outer membrane protein TolC